jgi:hypothetical protein
MTSSSRILPAISDQWSERAKEFSTLLADVATDDFGLVRTHIHFQERRALRLADLPKTIPLTPEGLSSVDFLCYEDAKMATGAFLAAQSIRWEVTREEQAKDLARTAFEALVEVYDLGATVSEGFFPKPYGGKISQEFSRDQYLFVLSGLAAYARICGDDELLLIRRMAAGMVDFWMRIDYKHSYFGLPSSSNLSDFMGGIFLGIASHGFRMGGDSRHWREYLRLFGEEGLDRRISMTLRGQFRDGVPYDGGMYFRQTENSVMLKCMAVDEVWESDPRNRPLWSHSLEKCLADDLTVALDPSDGLTFGLIAYDLASDATHLVDPGVVAELENPLNLPDSTWAGSRKRPGSAQTAYAAAVIADRIGSRKALDIYRLILDQMTYEKFRFVTVPDPTHLVPDHEWEGDLLASGQMAYWLWAYWLGRQRGLLVSTEDPVPALADEPATFAR